MVKGKILKNRFTKPIPDHVHQSLQNMHVVDTPLNKISRPFDFFNSFRFYRVYCFFLL